MLEIQAFDVVQKGDNIMKTRIFDSKEPIQVQQIDKAEQKLQCKLPDDYKQFLLKNNGGRLDPSDFESEWYGGFHEGLMVARVHYIYDLDRVLSFTDLLVERIPENMIVIGKDLEGNCLLMERKGKDYGKIYYWMLHPDEYGSQENDAVGFVADSFDEFINSVFDEEDY